MSNQGNVQASVRTRSGVTAELDYNGDWHYLWDQEDVPAGTFNERMLAWINVELSASHTNLPGAMQAYAESLGFYNWSSMTAIGEGITAEELFTEPLASNNTLNNYTLVVRIRMDDVSSPEAPSLSSITGIQAAVEGKVAKLYVGVHDGSGDEADAVSLTQITFAGEDGVDPPSITDVSTSDVVDFTWDGTTTLIFSIWTGATNAKIRNRAFTNYADLYAVSGVDEASLADKTGYSLTLGNNLFCIRGVTVYGDI